MAKITTSLYGELTLLPYFPMVPAIETIEFLTEIQESENGTEYRQQLRTLPRQSFGFVFSLPKKRMASAFNTEYGAIRKRWAIPLWTEFQNVGEVLAHSANIDCDTTQFDIRPDSLALLFNNEDDWQIAEISTITDTSVNITNDLHYQKSARLIPIRVGWVTDPISKDLNAIYARSSMKFFIDDLRDLTTSATPQQYFGNDIYYTCPLLGGEFLNREISQKEDTADESLGVVTRSTPWSNARYGTIQKSLLKNAAEIFEHRQFIYRRAGRYRPFWMPSFESSLRVINTGTITTTLLIEPDSFADYVPRIHIAIKTTDGQWHPLVAVNPTVVTGGKIELTLSASLDIDASEIVRVSYLGLYRLNTDSIDYNWIGGGKVQTQCAVLEITP